MCFNLLLKSCNSLAVVLWNQQNKKKNDHEGHRERMRNKYVNKGIEVFEQHEILEMLLFYAIPRKNTNDIAHRLLEACGSALCVLMHQ